MGRKERELVENTEIVIIEMASRLIIVFVTKGALGKCEESGW